MVKHVNRVIILKSGLLTGGIYIKPMQRLKRFFANVIWPIEATRLPPSVSSY
jgi:hypothetical protein